MNRLIISLLFTFFAFSGLKAEPIWIKAKMPSNVYAGDKFIVEFTINKLDLQHFAELRQELPKGFTAIEKNSGAADFSFKDQMVKFTWLRLPRSPQITISFEVVVSKSVKGSFSLPAQFTYIYKNQRGTANLEKDRMRVYSPGEVFSFTNEDLYSDISFPPKDPNLIQCLRVKPQVEQGQNAYTVKLLVSRGTLQRVAKIEEIIPAGYNTVLVDSKGANFSFENNIAEFFWTKMPKERNFEIVYKVIPTRNNLQAPDIDGNLVFNKNGDIMTIPVQQVESTSNLKKPVDDNVNKSDVLNFFDD